MCLAIKMEGGLLFVTAPKADHKVINRLLLYLRDWEYDSGDNFVLITSKSIKGLTQALQEPEEASGAIAPVATPTSAPIDPNLMNAWAGASIAEIEKLCLEVDKDERFGKAFNPHLFVVLDSKGIEDQTCVLAERVIDWDADPLVYPEKFNKTRVPWYQVYCNWCNLDISNLGWDELMVEDDAEEMDSLWWTYNTKDEGQYLSDEKRMLRDEQIAKLRCEGKLED